MKGINATADVQVSIDWEELGGSFAAASSVEQARFLEGMAAGFESIGWAATDSQLLEISLEVCSTRVAVVLDALTKWVQESKEEA